MTFFLFIDPHVVNEKDIFSYEHDTESFVSGVLLQYQQCQMECNQDLFVDTNDVKDTMPVADEHLSSSKYGARGSIDQSLLLPSDAEQMLRVRLSLP